MKVFNLLPLAVALMSNGAYAQKNDYLSNVMSDFENKIEHQLNKLRILAQDNSNTVEENGERYLIVNNIKYKIIDNGNINIPFRILSDDSAIRNIFPFFNDGWELTWYDSGAVFVNKNFGNYEYGNGCLLEYHPNHKESDNYVVKEDATCEYKDKIKTLSFQNENDVKINVDMRPTKVDSVIASVSDIENLNKEPFVKIDDITFEKHENQWYVVNKSFMPINEIVVSFNNKSPVLLNFDQDILGYSKARITLLNTEELDTISVINQTKMFNPYFEIGHITNPCSDKSKVCYNSPIIGPERETIERTYGHIYDSFNKISFIEKLENFYGDDCAGYYDCIVYTEQNPKGLGYAFRAYLALGIDNYSLSPRVMRNQYVAEGVGSGTGVNLNQMISNGYGFAAIWQEYIDVNHGAYRVLPMNTIFHETAHAYGFSHSSGMSYGMAEIMEYDYIPSEGVDITKMPYKKAPDIIVDHKKLSSNKISLRLLSKNNHFELSNLNIRLISDEDISFTANYIDDENTNELELTFSIEPQSPVYIQVWDQNSRYVSTLKFSPYYLGKEGYVSLYEHFNLGGAEVKINNDVEDLNIFGFDNNTSSFIIPDGWTVEFYDLPNYQGSSWTRGGGHHGAHDFNDRASSIKIIKEQ